MDKQLGTHFITFSCYRRRELLADEQAMGIVVSILASTLKKHNGVCHGFVIMPAHMHVMVCFDTPGELSSFMKEWKQRSSVLIKKHLKRIRHKYAENLDIGEPVWQRRFYSFNVFSQKKAVEKLGYMHHNPVQAKLVESQTDWQFSSARWYEDRTSVGVAIEAP